VSTRRVIVVAKRSAYYTQVLVRQDPVYLKLLADNDPTVGSLLRAHEDHEATLAQVLKILRELAVDFRVIDAPWEPFDLRGVSLVLTVGGDGTLLVTSHQLGPDIPILGINSSPLTSVGFFCGLGPDSCVEGIPRALQGKLASIELARMEVRIDSRVVSRRVLNDALYCHQSPAATSRYVVEIEGESEDHKSSGFWVGPAAGSTAAQRSAGGRILPLSSRELQLVVREPYGYTGPMRFARVLIPDGARMITHSKMPDGKLFLDGPHTAHDVGFGVRVTFRRSEEPLHVLGLTRRRRALVRTGPSVASSPGP
jgi:NAD+ kinase